MGLLDSIFGSSADIPSNSKLKNLDITPDQYKNLRSSLASILGGSTSGSSALNLSGIPSDAAYGVPATDQEMSLINQLFSRAGQSTPAVGMDSTLSSIAQGNTALQQANQQSILDTLSGKYLDPSSNPWLSKSVKAAQDDLEYAWQNQVMPNLRSSFTGSGQTITPGSYGTSAFDRAAALAANEQQRQLANTATNIYSNAYTSERANQLQALGLGQAETAQRAGAQTSALSAQQGQEQQDLAARQAQTKELTDTLQAVALPRLIEQYGVDAGTEEFRNRMSTLLQLLGMGLGATGATVSNAGAAASGSSGILGSLIGAAGQVGAAAAG